MGDAKRHVGFHIGGLSNGGSSAKSSYGRVSRKKQKAVSAAFASAFEAMETRVMFSLPATLPVTEQQVNFTPGPSIADPVRDVVYMVDATHLRLLAINTDTGLTTATTSLAGTAGGLAVSLDDTKIYVSEPALKQIEVFSLTNASSLTAVVTPIQTPVGVLQLIAGNANRLYGVVQTTNVVDQFDATSGAILNPIGTGFTTPKLATNLAHTHLYIMDTSGSATGMIPEYDISAATVPTLITTYNANLVNSTSIAVDEPSNHIYITNSNLNGVSVINTATNTETFPPVPTPTPTPPPTPPADTSNWYLGNNPSSAVGVAAQQGLHSVFAESGASLTATIRQFAFDTGAPQADYVVDNYSPLSVTIALDADSLRVTPNGHVLFTGNTTIGSSLVGIIGVSKLSLLSPTAAIKYTSLAGRFYQFDASNSTPPPGGTETITSYNWNFGDGTTGTGVTVNHTYAANGTFTVTLTVTASNGTTSSTTQILKVYSAVVPTPTPTPTGTGQIGGYVINDVNANARWNKGEPGIRGFTVFLDLNNDGKLDNFEPTTTSGRTGRWLFTNLPAGQYSIGLVNPTGWVQTFPVHTSTATALLSSGGTVYPITFLTHENDPAAYRNSLAAAAAAVVPAVQVASSSTKTMTTWLGSDKNVLG